MKHLTLLLLLFFFHTSFAQKTYWASKVEAFSSEYSEPKYTTEFKAIQVLGKPNSLPQGPGKEPRPAAWRPLIKDNDVEDYLIVSFDTIMPIRQVAIGENYGAGCITKIIAFDESNDQHLILENKTTQETKKEGIFNFFFPELTKYKVRAIKVIINSGIVKGDNQIDAIGISQSQIPIQATINLIKDIPKDFENYRRINLGKNINSTAQEIAPVIAPDGKTLYFTRQDHPENMGGYDAEKKISKQDVWFSELQTDKTWSVAKNIGTPINNASDNAICSITPDGQTVLLNNAYKLDGGMDLGVSTSKKLRTGWTFPTPLNISNFRNQLDFTEFSLHPNNRIIILTAKLKGSFGMKDMYVTFEKADGTWTEPKNLGKTVNSADDETAPFLASDGKTLYFSTFGRSGYGVNDIFVTRRLDDSWTNWTEPENLGPTINTPYWDGYFTLPANGDYAYIISYTNAEYVGDIYKLKVPDSAKPDAVIFISGTVINESDKKAIPARVTIKSLTNPADSNRVEYDPYLGEFKFMLQTKQSYSITAEKKDFLPVSEIIDLTKERNYKEIKKTLSILPLKADQRIVLNSVFFEQSKFELLPNSFEELDRMVLLMKEHPTLEIILEGFTDNIGDFNLNLKLSEDRVNSVKKYLVDKGVVAKRIQVKGWGAMQPLSNDISTQSRKQNRRVEFRILKI